MTVTKEVSCFEGKSIWSLAFHVTLKSTFSNVQIFTLYLGRKALYNTYVRVCLSSLLIDDENRPRICLIFKNEKVIKNYFKGYKNRFFRRSS